MESAEQKISQNVTTVEGKYCFSQVIGKIMFQTSNTILNF